MNRPGRRHNQEDESIFGQYTSHFLEELPEELAVLKGLSANDYINRVVRKGKFVGIVQNYVDSLARRDIDGMVIEERVREYICVTSVDVGAANVNYSHARLIREVCGGKEAIETLLHVLQG